MRIDALEPGAHFRQVPTGLCGRLIQADSSGATVEIMEARPEKVITPAFGEPRTIPAGFSPKRNWWSCATSVEPTGEVTQVDPPEPEAEPEAPAPFEVTELGDQYTICEPTHPAMSDPKSPQLRMF